MVSGFNKDLVGNQEITVSYSGKTTVFIITVKDKAEKYKPSTPSVPTLISKTANSVTLKNIEGYEYRCRTCGYVGYESKGALTETCPRCQASGKYQKTGRFYMDYNKCNASATDAYYYNQ